MKRKKWYLGYAEGKLNLFSSVREPTVAEYGDVYDFVWGPFRTKRAAVWTQKYGKGNPHCQHVDDAERLAKKFEEEQRVPATAFAVLTLRRTGQNTLLRLGTLQEKQQ